MLSVIINTLNEFNARIRISFNLGFNVTELRACTEKLFQRDRNVNYHIGEMQIVYFSAPRRLKESNYLRKDLIRFRSRKLEIAILPLHNKEVRVLRDRKENKRRKEK
jgi:hypothetical protein